MKKAFTMILSLSLAVVLAVSMLSGCSLDIPEASEVKSIRVATSYISPSGDYSSVKNAANYSSQSDIPAVLYSIEDTELIEETIEIAKEFEAAADKQGEINSMPIWFKCEYTLNNGSTVTRGFEKTIENSDEIFDDYLADIMDCAVSCITIDQLEDDDNWDDIE